MTGFSNSGTPASKVALQNQAPVYLPMDDDRNNPKFREQNPWVVFVDRSDPRITDPSSRDSVTRSAASGSPDAKSGNENPSLHDNPANPSGDSDQERELMNQNNMPDQSDGDAGIDYGAAATEGVDPDLIANSDGPNPDNSTQGVSSAPSVTRYSKTVMPPYNLSIQEETYVVENESGDGIPTYSVVLSFDAEGYELEYTALVVKQP